MAPSTATAWAASAPPTPRSSACSPEPELDAIYVDDQTGQPDGHLSEAEEQELWRHYGLKDAGAGRTTADADRDAVGRDTSGPTTDDAMTRSEEEHEVTLREEEVVVDKRAVPKERVRLDTETVTEERQVADEVRKEQIEVEDNRR